MMRRVLITLLWIASLSMVPIAHASAGSDAGGPTRAPDLATLAALLADSDSRSVDWWQAHEAALGRQLDPVALRALSRAIGRFDFDAALLLCQRVQQGNRVSADAAPISRFDSLTT